MSDLVKLELEHRIGLWQNLIKTGETKEVKPQRLRELGIYGGAQGIWIDKNRTQQVTQNQTGVTVGLLHTGTSYTDDLSGDGVIYHYPTTGRAGLRDNGEVESTKMAKTLRLPVFVITPGLHPLQDLSISDGWKTGMIGRNGSLFRLPATHQPKVDQKRIRMFRFR